MSAREARLADALDRIARFAEAYEEVSDSRNPIIQENVGFALCITLGRYARRILDETARHKEAFG
jgi:hypothetical protein